MRIYKNWFTNHTDILVLEEGNEKITIFQHGTPIVCAYAGVMFHSKIDQLLMHDITVTLRRRSLFGHGGVTVEVNDLQHKLTVAMVR